eukprot:3603767-Rhodomonas_salina.2
MAGSHSLYTVTQERTEQAWRRGGGDQGHMYMWAQILRCFLGLQVRTCQSRSYWLGRRQGCCLLDRVHSCRLLDRAHVSMLLLLVYALPHRSRSILGSYRPYSVLAFLSNRMSWPGGGWGSVCCRVNCRPSSLTEGPRSVPAI